MKATVVDLRYRMNDVLKALDRNENVSVLYHGKVKGVIKPLGGSTVVKVTAHPFFNIRSTAGTVDKLMDGLRGGRYRDL